MWNFLCRVTAFSTSRVITVEQLLFALVLKSHFKTWHIQNNGEYKFSYRIFSLYIMELGAFKTGQN